MLSTAIRGPMILGLPITPSPSSASGIIFVIVFSQFEMNLSEKVEIHFLLVQCSPVFVGKL
jgi:hypothetical protein